jgi:UDP-N-acetylmuramyl pentapeptide phosphotransferase/UDP-N-acetylglucosamine-1-phosphate transferase
MILEFLIFLAIFFGMEVFYFRLAEKYEVIDRPNHRSSHSRATIRGGGVIFPIAFCLPLLTIRFANWEITVSALMLIAIVSFVDDMLDLRNTIRLVAQGAAVLIFILSEGSGWPLIELIVVFIVAIGSINAFNFMDGINGITGLYALVTLGSIAWMNNNVVPVIPNIFLVSLIAAVCAFSYFNIRKQARCFAGDVGSVSMAFIICVMLLLLIVATDNYCWVLFFGVYGIDVVWTLICRFVRKEEIFKAHRSHFYQYLVNERSMGHIPVAAIYGAAQLVLNLVVISGYLAGNNIISYATLLCFLFIYAIFRLRLEGWHRLFVHY